MKAALVRLLFPFAFYCGKIGNTVTTLREPDFDGGFSYVVGKHDTKRINLQPLVVNTHHCLQSWWQTNPWGATFRRSRLVGL